MAEGSKIGHQVLAVIEETGPLERQADDMGAALLYGMGRGVVVNTDVCDQYMLLRQTRSLEEIDLKLARLAIDAGNTMLRVGSKVMEEAFRRRRDDTVGKLLEQLRVAETVEKPEPEKK